MKKNAQTISWILRIVIFILFVVSAITKVIDPIWMFEKQLVDLGICDWCLSHYLARLLIGFELALGIAILFPHLLKKLVVPVTIALLVAFCIHLSIQMVEYGPMNGNCGCFGTTIPMTPLEAFIKNVLTIGLLVWLYRLLPSTKDESWKRIIYPILIFLLCALFMFMAYPFCPCDKKPKPTTVDIEETTTEETANTIDEIDNLEDSVINSAELSAIEKQQIQDSLNEAKKKIEEEELERKKKEAAAEEKKRQEDAVTKDSAEKGPKKVTSKFAQLPVFSGKKVNVDEGKKTICMFAPGCDHCQHTAKLLGELAQKGKTPPVYIYFMDEEPEKIPEFFKKAGVKFPYQVLGIGDFWDLLEEGSTPGVFGLWNGNIQQSYEGINENEFDVEKFKSFALPKN
jgi:thiol-disulfide isomerase/thioredoxin